MPQFSSELTPEQIEEIYQKLPEDIKMALFSEVNALFIRQTAAKFHLPPEKIPNLAEMVGDVMIGIIPLTDFKQALQDSLDIDGQMSHAITQEVNFKIFTPIRLSLRKIHGLVTPEEISIEPTPSLVTTPKPTPSIPLPTPSPAPLKPTIPPAPSIVPPRKTPENNPSFTPPHLAIGNKPSITPPPKPTTPPVVSGMLSTRPIGTPPNNLPAVSSSTQTETLKTQPKSQAPIPSSATTFPTESITPSPTISKTTTPSSVPPIKQPVPPPPSPKPFIPPRPLTPPGVIVPKTITPPSPDYQKPAYESPALSQKPITPSFVPPRVATESKPPSPPTTEPVKPIMPVSPTAESQPITSRLASPSFAKTAENKTAELDEQTPLVSKPKTVIPAEPIDLTKININDFKGNVVDLKNLE